MEVIVVLALWRVFNSFQRIFIENPATWRGDRTVIAESLLSWVSILVRTGGQYTNKRVSQILRRTGIHI